jgi:hypothetical protein
MTRRYRYARGVLAADYARGAAGLAVTAGPLVLLQPAPAVGWALGMGAALFLVYCTRSVVRQFTRIELDEAGLAARGPLGNAIRWEDLRSVRLKYYTTQRGRSGGWMQLVLRGAHRSIRVESGIDGFAEIAHAAALELTRRGGSVDELTRTHLTALGIRVESGADDVSRSPSR